MSKMDTTLDRRRWKKLGLRSVTAVRSMVPEECDGAGGQRRRLWMVGIATEQRFATAFGG
ncbi:unnamed protein product [Cuscuta epithymum]|uniref:Uncharacterized protein n=1 Tax=Cuscuta epithymum TaxID=186058 RepID=A0AAV0E593_9ASTE|nr:unnamed protein product [Cuscuta epithymum]